MYLVVGLGNYPKEYELTRHNVGFMCLDNLAQKYNVNFKTEVKFKSDFASINLNDKKIILLKPLTFMNLSGEAVQKIVSFYKIKPENVLIVFDDISLDLGKFRFRSLGTDGGHNGIKSIINLLGTQKFDRLKIGIGPQPKFVKSETFVLQHFSNEQILLLNKVICKSIDAIEDYFNLGIYAAQNKYNGLNLNV